MVEEISDQTSNASVRCLLSPRYATSFYRLQLSKGKIMVRAIRHHLRTTFAPPLKVVWKPFSRLWSSTTSTNFDKIIFFFNLDSGGRGPCGAPSGGTDFYCHTQYQRSRAHNKCRLCIKSGVHNRFMTYLHHLPLVSISGCLKIFLT